MSCACRAMVVVLAVVVFACRTAHPAPEVAAVIVAPTERSRAALHASVSAALGGRPVTLCDDALTRSSTLMVEGGRLRGPSGLPADGRQRGGPELFRLVRSGAECVLVHERTGDRFALAETSCVPAPGGP